MTKALPSWEPMRDFVTPRDAMDRLFEESYVQPELGQPSPAGPVKPINTWRLPVDIYTTPEEVVIVAAVPGIKPEDGRSLSRVTP